MKIKDWPLDDRPREKFFERGSYALTSTELLAIIIGKGMKNRSAHDVAKDLLEKTGGLKQLSLKTVSEVERLGIPGLGRAKIIAVLAALDLGRRALSTRSDKGNVFRTAKDIYNYYYPMLMGLKHEEFLTAAVDGQYRLIRYTTISKGIRDASLVHPREVFAFAFMEKADALFLIHNHPSGVLKPSDEDLRITERLHGASKIMGIPIIDHVIIADNDFYSFSQHNLL